MSMRASFVRLALDLKVESSDTIDTTPNSGRLRRIVMRRLTGKTTTVEVEMSYADREDSHRQDHQYDCHSRDVESSGLDFRAGSHWQDHHTSYAFFCEDSYQRDHHCST